MHYRTARIAESLERETIMIQSIVTSAKGAWQYQDAFRVAQYAPYITRDGRVLLRSVGRSAKYSWPQLRREGFTASITSIGSLHNARPQAAVIDDYGNLIGAYHDGNFAHA